jgi:transglutaminase-like putative cysteine protease
VTATATALRAGGATAIDGAPAEVAARRRDRAPALELVAFAALALYGLSQWSRLIVAAPFGRLLAALAIACLGGAALLALGRGTAGRSARRMVAVAIAIATVAGALVAVGLPVRLLAPAHWGELREDLRVGVTGIEHTDLPYRGADDWVRLTSMLGAAALVALASVIAFWPGRRPAVARTAGLAVLVTLFGIAATLRSPAQDLLWGAGLLVLVGAWLWLPALSRSDRAPALAWIAAAAAVAIPVTARLGDGGWWPWRDWNLFAPALSVSFEWDHTYGPLAWPQRGTTLLEAHSSQSHYWKVSVLDRFDGFSWQRAAAADPLAEGELAARAAPLGAELADRHPEWIAQPDFELRALSSDLVVAAGATQAVRDLDAEVAADGTVAAGPEPLARGDRYSALVYDPRPSVAQLRETAQRYPRRARGSTVIGVPSGPPPTTTVDGRPDPTFYTSADTDDLVPVAGIPVPTWGHPQGRVRRAILRSPYADVYRLARRTTADAPTVYDAVSAIQRELRKGPYGYTPDVHNYPYPLPAFLFVDQRGYCQQFSGAMALMLRMLGIPSRVVTGFAPGHFDPTTGDYEVRDLDAHSWVEVFFPRIGWVTFDPTPAAAPAFAQANDALGHPVVTSDPTGGAQAVRDAGRAAPTDVAGAGGAGASGGGPWTAIALGLLAVGATTLLAGVVIAERRAAALRRGALADAQVAELIEALRRLGWPVGDRLTLNALERRFRAGGRTAVAGYAAGLREHRYGRRPVPPPGPPARRALRHSLAAGGGLRRRLRAVIAIPPGGPPARRAG